MKPKLLRLIAFCGLLTSCMSGFSQQLVIKGRVINSFTKEPVPFASIFFKQAGNGVVSDSTGHYIIKKSNRLIKDTLVLNYVGYVPSLTPVSTHKKDTLVLDLYLSQLQTGGIVEVKSKFNKGLRWWKNIVTYKAKNNPFKYNSYAYELYNKMELDISHFKKEMITDKKLLKPFAFILNNVDSLSEKDPFLPVYMTETISNYYYYSHPENSREEIIAAKTDGIKNESVLAFIGGINQKINIYDNITFAMGKEFISPFSDYGDRYYNYKGADTQYIGKQAYFHLLFTPKRQGENTFSGDCWIHSGNWGIQRVNLEISNTANINFIQRLGLVQEFSATDSNWIFVKDKTIIDFNPFGKEKISFIARRTNSYRNVLINHPSITDKLIEQQGKKTVTVNTSAAAVDATFWQGRRHEELSSNENKVYQMMDSIKSMPVFKKYSNWFTFLVDGHHKMGKFEIGPWFKWISGNQLEQFRFRFDLGTTALFSKNLRLHGYLAYGTRDERFKGKLDVTYRFPGEKGITLQGSYTDDLDNGRTRYNEEDITTDNVFSQLIRRPGIPQKFLGVNEIKFSATKEWKSKLSLETFITQTDYTTYHPLPNKRSFIVNQNKNDIISSEIGWKLRYAPGERTIDRHRKSIQIKGNLPVIVLRTAFGINDLLQSDYQYVRTGLQIFQNTRIPRWGKLNYMVYGGKIFTDQGLPFMLLENHPGNEVFYYSKQAFNLMNRFEYISDEYAGINLEHNFEKKLLNLLPFMRNSNMRQFWNIKAVWGNLASNSRILNRTEYLYDYRLRSLRGEVYTEIGTGIENIFKILRIDLVWRHAPVRRIPAGANPNLFKSPIQDFGIFGSVRIQF